MNVFLCVAPDGSLELWERVVRKEIWNNGMAAWMILLEYGTTHFFDATWETQPPEFWGREVIDQWY